MKKFMQVCLCILLITCVMGTTMINAYCAPLLLLLEAPAFIAVVKGLIAAGLVFGAAYGISNMSSIVNEYWAQQSEAIKQQWLSYGIGAVTLGIDVWNSLRAFVQGKATAEGTQSFPVSPLNVSIQFADTTGKVFTITSLPATSAGQTGVYSDYVLIGTTANGAIYAMYTSVVQGYAMSYNAASNSFYVTPDSRYGSSIYTYDSYSSTWNLWGNFYSYNNKSLEFFGNLGKLYWIALEGSDPTTMANKWNDFAAKGCPFLVNSTTGTVTVISGALNPDYDYTNSKTNDRTIVVPTVTPETVNDVATTLTDITAGDIAAEDVPTTIPETGTLAGVIAAVQSVAQSVERFFDTSKTINWQPLVVVGGNLKSIFPFSLPWDLYGLIARLDYPPVEPVINIHLAKGPLTPEMNWKLDMTDIKPYFAVLRTMELFIFFIVLIMKTRTLMGGDV